MGETNERISLPLVLAGPILRRVEQDRVCVWIATSQPRKIAGWVVDARDTFKGARVDARFPPILASGTALPLSLGPSLHVTLLELRPPGRDLLVADSLLAYNLALLPLSKEEAGQGAPGTQPPQKFDRKLLLSPDRLDSHPEFAGADRVSYAPFTLPTFFISQKTPMNILHGSCRKLHGSPIDALASADALIKESVDSVQGRPSALLLTGDQIYGDDVALLLSRHITRLSAELLQRHERFPLPGGGEKEIKGVPLGQRFKEVVGQFFTMDAEAGQNHLIGFGEYAAMYLLSWNRAVWPDSLMPDDSGLPGVSRSALRRRIQEEANNLFCFRETLPAVRRALANLATYMIFDDHEVTDDWNRTSQWTRQVYGSRTGKRIVTNALAAYAIFQGWGNDPGALAPTLLSHIADFVRAGGTGQASSREDDILRGPPQGWGFIAPTTPPVLFLDTRTRRHFVSGVNQSPPALMDRRALDDFGRQVTRLAADHPGLPLLLVSPSPPLGDQVLESGMAELPDSKGDTADLEYWVMAPQAFCALLRNCLTSGARSCIFLSGDVHFSFVASGTLTQEAADRDRGRSIQLVQFTSSGLNNLNSATVQRAVAQAINYQVPHFYSDLFWTRTDGEFVAADRLFVPGNNARTRAVEAGALLQHRLRYSLLAPGTTKDVFLHQHAALGQLQLDAAAGQAVCRHHVRRGGPISTITVALNGRAEQDPVNRLEVAIHLISLLLEGRAPEVPKDAALRQAFREVQAVLDKEQELVGKLRRRGVLRRTASGTELVRPPPPQVIAGFLGLAPRDPGFVFTLP